MNENIQIDNDKFKLHLDGLTEYINNCIENGKYQESNEKIKDVISMCKNMAYKLNGNGNNQEELKTDSLTDKTLNDDNPHSIYFEKQKHLQQINIESDIKTFLNEIFENYKNFLFDKIFIVNVSGEEIRPIYFFSIYSDSIESRLKNIQDFQERFKKNIKECGEGFLKQELQEGEGAISRGNGSKCIDMIFKMKDYVVCFKYSQGNINDIEKKTGLNIEVLLKSIYKLYANLSGKI